MASDQLFDNNGSLMGKSESMASVAKNSSAGSLNRSNESVPPSNNNGNGGSSMSRSKQSRDFREYTPGSATAQGPTTGGGASDAAAVRPRNQNMSGRPQGFS